MVFRVEQNIDLGNATPWYWAINGPVTDPLGLILDILKRRMGHNYFYLIFRGIHIQSTAILGVHRLGFFGTLGQETHDHMIVHHTWIG